MCSQTTGGPLPTPSVLPLASPSHPPPPVSSSFFIHHLLLQGDTCHYPLNVTSLGQMFSFTDHFLFPFRFLSSSSCFSFRVILLPFSFFFFSTTLCTLDLASRLTIRLWNARGTHNINITLVICSDLSSAAAAKC